MLLWASTLAAQDAYLPSDQVTTPRVLKSFKPSYTVEAMLRRIEGNVVLQVDVRPDGTVGTVALVKSLGLDELDAEAVKAVKRFQFAPGEKNGKPVTVRTEVSVAFIMR
jgi:protein TonB